MKVNETRCRSLFKAISFRVIEILFDTFILSLFVDIKLAFGLAVFLEITCFTLHYIFERVWNKIDYGRNAR